MSDETRELKEKAQALLVKRQHRKALTLFEKVSELEPDDGFAAKKVAEILDTLGEKDRAAERYLSLAALLERRGHRLQAIASCRLALVALPNHAAATAMLATLYQPAESQASTFSLNQQALARARVNPPHVDSATSAAASAIEPASANELSPIVVKHVETFVRTLTELCVAFSGTVLSPQTQSLTDSITGNTDFLWIVQFSGGAAHSVVISAQRRFIVGLTKRVLDVDEAMVSDAIAMKLSNKFVGMYVDDVKRAFAATGEVVHSAPPLPVSGTNASYQLRGTQALHVPMLSEIGWVQLTVTGV